MLTKSSFFALCLVAVASATHYPGLGLHNDNQAGLAINGVPAKDRDYWMSIANSAVREINGDPCGIAPFGVAVVNTTSNELVCVAANRVGLTGNPTQHGEMTGFDVCSEILREKGLSPKEMLAAWKSFTMYTNGEPCPMCASALRWSGIGEVVWGTSIETIISGGRSQIYLPSSLIVSASYSLGHQSLWLGSVLSEETDKNFLYQFNESYPCPESCERVKLEGSRVSSCQPVKGWRESWEKRKGQWEQDLMRKHGAHAHAHDEL
ncbi:cytidine deaminase-like protein [Meredithblackwellia eburnea MCA 4105]